ncbi:ABC transporter substrate-binding protein [Cohnella boryungensis]|uniref:ABC transporter substrate-binding protein n=1 Tax=Cohnella boryungensis TaxID=768479 RepID=A0ABV8SHE1_9BACL
MNENDSEEALGYAMAYIEQHYQKDLTIEQLAKVAGISSRHFMRLFKKRYGYSAIDYLALYRIERAQQLMRTGVQYRLRDIARHVGYHDDMYFRRKFKQISGIPPAAFVKNGRQKIVAYHSSNIGQLLALQITPCAAPADHPWTDYYQRKYKTNSVLPLSSYEETKREELRLAAPDFIIGVDSLVSAEEQESLGEIAPAFFVPWMEYDWRKHMSAIAQFLGRTAVAETWLNHYERKARTASEQIKNVIKDDSLLILRICGGRITVLGSRSIRTVFYDDLLVVPARGVNEMSDEKQVSPAQLMDFDADRLLLIVDEDALSKSSWKSLADSELWNNLKAVRNGRVAFLPPYPWVEYTAFTNELLLDEALKLWRNCT